MFVQNADVSCLWDLEFLNIRDSAKKSDSIEMEKFIEKHIVKTSLSNKNT